MHLRSTKPQPSLAEVPQTFGRIGDGSGQADVVQPGLDAVEVVAVGVGEQVGEHVVDVLAADVQAGSRCAQTEGFTHSKPVTSAWLVMRAAPVWASTWAMS